MSYNVNSLPYPPINRLQLPAALDPTFKESERKQHATVWAPLEAYGIMPCGKGVQVYAQPQTVEQITRLAEALRLVALRLTTKGGTMKS